MRLDLTWTSTDCKLPRAKAIRKGTWLFCLGLWQTIVRGADRARLIISVAALGQSKRGTAHILEVEMARSRQALQTCVYHSDVGSRLFEPSVVVATDGPQKPKMAIITSFGNRAMLAIELMCVLKILLRSFRIDITHWISVSSESISRMSSPGGLVKRSTQASKRTLRKPILRSAYV
jgi:hypothetical protein